MEKSELLCRLNKRNNVGYNRLPPYSVENLGAKYCIIIPTEKTETTSIITYTAGYYDHQLKWTDVWRFGWARKKGIIKLEETTTYLKRVKWV